LYICISDYFFYICIIIITIFVVMENQKALIDFVSNTDFIYIKKDEKIKDLFSFACIYLIKSPVDKFYIGKTVNASDRIKDYIRKKNTSQRKLYNSFNKYGKENHQFIILKKCEKIELNELEIFYINLFQTFDTEFGLNLHKGGQGGRCSDESIEIIRQKAKGRIFSDEHKKNIGLSKKGKESPLKEKPKSKESIEKRVAILKRKYANGELKVWNKGILRTKEEKNKMSLSKIGKPSKLKGRKMSEETKEKLRQANLGKKQSEETKQKKREIALKNGNKPPLKIWTDEERKRWSEMSVGKKNGNYKHGKRIKNA